MTAEALKQEALEVASRVLGEFPDDPDSHALKGSVCFFHGNTIESEKCWQRCLELDPRRADVYDAMSMVAWHKGDFEKAAAACRRALELDPKMTSACIRLGRSLLELDRIEESIAVMQRAAGVSPRSGDCHFFLGQGYLLSKQYGKAQASFRRAAEVEPGHTRSYYGLATASAKLGQPEQAKQYEEKFRNLKAAELETLKTANRRQSILSGVAEERTTTANACTGAAGIYRRHGNMQRAEQLWRRAAIIDPDNTVCRGELMALYQRGNRFDDALAFCRQLAQLQPKNARNYFYMGNVHARRGNYDDAEQAYRKVRQLAPDRPEGYRALVQLYMATGRNLPEAKELAGKVAKMEPDPRHYLLWATVCNRSGDRAGALAALEQSLERDPHNTECRRLYHLLREEK